MNPFERIKCEVDVKLHEKIPKKWKKIGDIIITDFSRLDSTDKRDAASIYAKILNAKTIIQKKKINGELRKPGNTEVIFGHDTETEIIEYGIKYKMDLSKIMWSPGNTGWRSILNGPPKVKNFYKFDSPNIIMDFFAGIGYFAIQLAKSYPETHIIAIDKNPDSIEYLKKNIKLNGISNIEVINDDCRNINKISDVIHLGYIGNTIDFLEHAKDCLTSKGIVIFHETYFNSWLGFKKRSDWKGIPSVFSETMMQKGFVTSDFERVKFYGPSKSHIIAKLKKIT